MIMKKFRCKNVFIGVVFLIFILLIMTSCSKEKNNDRNISVKDIDEKIIESIDISNMDMADEERLEKLYDIDIEFLQEFVLYVPKTNIEVNELFVLRAKDKDDIDDIKEKIENRIEEQSDNFRDYLPEEYYLIEKHVLNIKGNYILFAISEEAETIEDIFNQFFK